MELNSIQARIPAALWESLQTICWEQDNKFLEDVARIINVPAALIKKRVLGTRGVVSAVVCTSQNWFEGTQCPIMIHVGGDVWRRCAAAAESSDCCHDHRKKKMLRYDSECFADLPKLSSWRLEGEPVWVDGDGFIYNSVGERLKDRRIDLTNGVCYDDRPTPAPWTRDEHDAAAARTDDDDPA